MDISIKYNINSYENNEGIVFIRFSIELLLLFLTNPRNENTLIIIQLKIYNKLH